MTRTPPYSESATRYDMHTLWGRTRYWASSLNPLMLLETERSVRAAQLQLDAHKQHGHGDGASDEQLWHARTVVEQCVHPTTDEVIFPIFRMCCFLPANYFIVPFMMAPSTVTSVGRTLFIQWLNQSYNAAINYANRSSDRQPMSEIAKAYAAAVTVACGGSLGATALLRRIPASSVPGMLVRATVPCIAVSAASIVNLAFMRKNEWMSTGTGLAVKDEDGAVRGYSVTAGRDSLLKCSITRVMWNLPSMVLPTLLMMVLPGVLPVARTYPGTTEGLLQMLGLTLGVPPALALYNVHQTLPESRLEMRLQGLRRLDGTPVQQFTYYKGL